MSQQNNSFASGFFTGAIVGGVVGGVIGALVSYRRDSEPAAEEEDEVRAGLIEARKAAKRRSMKASEQEEIEMELARRSLEDKIAQLNATIDEVRQQLGQVNGSTQAINEQPSRSEER